MVTEDYINFETAKLLKEKGFNGVCKTAYETITNEHEVEQCSPSSWGNLNQVKRPTLQMAMKWLMEEHNLVITTYFTVDGWHSCVSRIKFNGEGVFIIKIIDGIDGCNILNRDTYEEACEASIKYCLENLI